MGWVILCEDKQTAEIGVWNENHDVYLDGMEAIRDLEDFKEKYGDEYNFYLDNEDNL